MKISIAIALVLALVGCDKGKAGAEASASTWEIAGQDATIEFFTTIEDANARAEYVKGIGAKSPMTLQYVYVSQKWLAVLRVPHQLTPTDAKKWEQLTADF